MGIPSSGDFVQWGFRVVIMYDIFTERQKFGRIDRGKFSAVKKAV